MNKCEVALRNGIDSSVLTEEHTEDDSTERQNSISPEPNLALSDNSFLDFTDRTELRSRNKNSYSFHAHTR